MEQTVLKRFKRRIAEYQAAAKAVDEDATPENGAAFDNASLRVIEVGSLITEAMEEMGATSPAPVDVDHGEGPTALDSGPSVESIIAQTMRGVSVRDIKFPIAGQKLTENIAAGHVNRAVTDIADKVNRNKALMDMASGAIIAAATGNPQAALGPAMTTLSSLLGQAAE